MRRRWGRWPRKSFVGRKGSTRRGQVACGGEAARLWGQCGMFAMGEGSCLKPGGIWKAEVGTDACEKLDFWVAVDIRTTVCVAGAPVAVVGAGAGSGARAGGGAAFLWWEPPRTELARALVTMSVLPLTWLAAPEAVCVATSPPTDWPEGVGWTLKGASVRMNAKGARARGVARRSSG